MTYQSTLFQQKHESYNRLSTFKFLKISFEILNIFNLGSSILGIREHNLCFALIISLFIFEAKQKY